MTRWLQRIITTHGTTGGHQEATPPRPTLAEKQDEDGTLLHRSKALVQHRVSSAKQEARHIHKWSQLMIDGWEAFSKAILRDRNRVNPAPLVFAVMANGEPFIQVAHTFGHMAPEDKTRPYDGSFGCFLGDRTVVDFQGETIIQEPAFSTKLCDLSSISGIHTRSKHTPTIKRAWMRKFQTK